MTSPRLPPKLDILLSREVEVTPAGPPVVSFRYDTRASFASETAGRWAAGGQTLAIAYTDADGMTLPTPGTLTLDADSMVTIASGDYSVTLPFTEYEQGRGGFNSPIDAAVITFTGDLDLTQLPAFNSGDDLRVTLPAGGVPTPVLQTVRVWATRRDFAARDFLSISQTLGIISTSDTRFLVRRLGHPWAAGDRLTDEHGDLREIRGVVEYPAGRGRFLELLARRLESGD